ncbi:MAG: hypothetical protein RLZZ453_293 [Chlamydiota bacterium]|jgi:hypothetical protein
MAISPFVKAAQEKNFSTLWQESASASVPDLISAICWATDSYWSKQEFAPLLAFLKTKPNSIKATESPELIDVLFMRAMQQNSKGVMGAFLESGRVSQEGINRAYLGIDWFHSKAPNDQEELRQLFLNTIDPQSTLYKTQKAAIEALKSGKIRVTKTNSPDLLITEAVALGLQVVASQIWSKFPVPITPHIKRLDILCNRENLSQFIASLPQKSPERP